MKFSFFYCLTSLDAEAARACGRSEPTSGNEALPAPLAQIDHISILECDYENGARLQPVGFRLTTLERGKHGSEDDIISLLDIDLAIAASEPGSFSTTLASISSVLFYRALKHGVDLIILGGEPGDKGRVFGSILDPVAVEGQPRPTFPERCAGLGIPLLAAMEALPGDDPTSLARLSEVCACAGWLLTLLLSFPGNSHRVRKNWEQLAQWIEADPSRQHLHPFASASPLRGDSADTQPAGDGDPGSNPD